MLQYHILHRSICASAILNDVTLRTKEGQKVNLSCNVHDQITVNGEPSVETDIVRSNGVIHAIDHVLLPDSGTLACTRLG